jgi:hypothetical protein
MKPYFAKYLPAKKGEITGAFLRPDDKLVIMNDEQKRHYTDQIAITYVKLFLCSRYMQIGDEVFDIRTGQLVEVNNACGIELYKDKPNGFQYKVIGEISTEAKWVKDGDIFDADELAIQALAPGNFHILTTVLSVEKTEPNLTYLIKGPCGHFH